MTRFLFWYYDMWSGEVLRGDRIVNTMYTVLMNLDKKCEVLCKKPDDPIKLSVDESKLLAERIQEEYYVHLWVPSLPLTTLFGFSHETWAEQCAKFFVKSVLHIQWGALVYTHSFCPCFMNEAPWKVFYYKINMSKVKIQMHNNITYFCKL